MEKEKVKIASVHLQSDFVLQNSRCWQVILSFHFPLQFGIIRLSRVQLSVLKMD
jgi:hypothetical protein